MRLAPQVGDRVWFQGWPHRVGPCHGIVQSVTPLHWVPMDGGEPRLASEKEWVVSVELDHKPRLWRGRGENLVLHVRAFELQPSCGQKLRSHARARRVSLEVRP
jgi:hypothetical protein